MKGRLIIPRLLSGWIVYGIVCFLLASQARISAQETLYDGFTREQVIEGMTQVDPYYPSLEEEIPPRWYKPALAFSAWTEKQIFLPGEPIKVFNKVTNISKRVVYIRRDLRFDADCRLRDPWGKPFPDPYFGLSRCLSTTVTEDYFLRLEPGQSFEFSGTLNTILMQPGVYSIPGDLWCHLRFSRPPVKEPEDDSKERKKILLQYIPSPHLFIRVGHVA